MTTGKNQRAQYWKDTILSVIGSLHYTLSDVLGNVDEGFVWAPSLSTLPTLPTPNSLSEVLRSRMTQQTAYFQGLSQCITALLHVNVEKPVELPINQVMALLQRVLVLDLTVVHTCTIELRRTLLLLHLPTYLVTGFNLLQTLLHALRAAMTPHAVLILALVSSVLQAYPSHNRLHIAVYQCLQHAPHRPGGPMRTHDDPMDPIASSDTSK